MTSAAAEAAAEPAPSREPPVPKVSVILPNYRHAPYLPRRIESVLAQTHADFELLILDDASPDNSRDVALAYAGDARVRFAFNEENSGNPYFQWKKGLGLTTGDYVWIAESDDFADATLLQSLVACLDANPAVGLALCETVSVDTEDRPIRNYFEDWGDTAGLDTSDLSFLGRAIVMNGRDYCDRHMRPWNTIPNASAVVFRRAAFDAIGGPVTDMRLCGDWLTYCKMLMQFDIARIPERLNYFREHLVNVRSGVKAGIFVRESLAVRDYLARSLGRPEPAAAARQARSFYCQALVSRERSPSAGTVPLALFPALLRDAARLGPGMLAGTLAILFRERVGALVRPLRPSRQQ